MVAATNGFLVWNRTAPSLGRAYTRFHEHEGSGRGGVWAGVDRMRNTACCIAAASGVAVSFCVSLASSIRGRRIGST